MKSCLRGLLALGLAALVAGALTAEDKKPEKKKKKGGEPFAGVFAYPKAITLDEKQQEQVAALKKQYVPKLTELAAKQGTILTKERVKAAKTAAKAAKDEGKKGKEVKAAYDAALKLTKEEKQTLAEVNRERGKLFKEINQKKMALLTAEQREALKPKKKPKPKDTEKKA